jgi:hypothetical protein
MNHRDLVERLATEIEKACANDDWARARKLAALQREALEQISLDMAADPSCDPLAVPCPRPVPRQEKADSP